MAQETNQVGQTFPIIVIGASAGGFEALKKLIIELPVNTGAAVLIVWHLSSEVSGILPQVLNKLGKIPAKHPEDHEEIRPDMIYVAPPDFHMTLQESTIRLTKGPKENRFRPAIDPLFRSAAYFHGNRIIGVILSGYLDDGTSGLWLIKEYGGTTVVQDPADAEIKGMPESAIRAVKVDYIVALDKMASLLVQLVKETRDKTSRLRPDDDRVRLEIDIAAQAAEIKNSVMLVGEASRFTCPDCHGVFGMIREGNIVRFRCHTGHAYSPQNLLEAINSDIEQNLYNTLRAYEEKALLLDKLKDHLATMKEFSDETVQARAVKETEHGIETLRVLLERKT